MLMNHKLDVPYTSLDKVLKKKIIVFIMCD